MQFDSFSAFINMGGYAFFVWLSFGVSFLLIAALIISSRVSQKSLIKTLQAKQKRENKLKHVAQMTREQGDLAPDSNTIQVQD